MSRARIEYRRSLDLQTNVTTYDYEWRGSKYGKAKLSFGHVRPIVTSNRVLTFPEMPWPLRVVGCSDPFNFEVMRADVGVMKVPLYLWCKWMGEIAQ